jgi:vacuolar iron transporter family protein
MANQDDIRRYIAFLDDERNSAMLYRALSETDENPKIAGLYKRLAETEERHARVWEEKLKEAGVAVPEFWPAFRTRALIILARWFGIEAVLPTLSAIEDVGTEDYAGHADSKGLVADERSHATLLRTLEKTSGGVAGSTLARLEGRHRVAGGNALRAAVLGASDGLLSNFNLVMGVAGAALATRNILLTGLAGLLAGAISMALGEWISVQSSRELYAGQIKAEKEEIEKVPEEEAEELVLIYEARGMDGDSARKLAEKIISNKETALDTLVREELGINPQELGGSAWEAAIMSFLLFAAGAIVPVIPYMFLGGTHAIVASALLSAAALFAVGAAITLFTGRSVLYSGMRQVVFGLVAAGFTFFIGRLIGVAIS